MPHTDHERIRDAVGIVEQEIIGALAEEPAPPEDAGLASALAGGGFSPTAESMAAFRSTVRQMLTAAPSGADRIVDVFVAIRQTPSADAALVNLERFLVRAGSASVFLDTIVPAKPVLEMIAVVFGGSQYMADIIVRNPNLVYWLMEAGTWDAPDTAGFYREWLARETFLFDGVDARLDALRRAHRQALLRIGILDLLGRASVEATTARLSLLADAVAQIVLDIVREAQRPDSPELPSDLAVIALGKLGGRELNYSSDIDLVYVCGDGEGERVAIHTNVAKRFGEAIAEASGEGYLYRVDLRLRPDGKAGPLVNSETAMRLYYENRGRPWEFQAMLKARVVAGDVALGERFLDSLQRLVYNTSLSYSPLKSIAAMREQIRDGMDARERGFNIKLMEGGIRDIEFTVQTLQLLHGPTHSELRGGHTLDALDQIRRLRLLDDWKVDNLAAAYRFFRVVEHRLQMMHQIKTHRVPTSGEELALLARRVSRGPVGTYNSAEFLEALSRHLGNVRTIAGAFFGGEDVHPHLPLLMLPEDDPRSQEILRRFGLRDATRAIRALHTMAYGAFPRLLDRGARRAFEGLLPLLLEDVRVMPDPETTLVNVSDIGAAGRNESSFYALLTENKAARELVVGIAGLSSYLSRRLCNQIDTLDALLQSQDEVAFETQFRSIPEWDRFSVEVARRGGGAAEERRERQRAWLDRTRLHAFALNYRKRFRPQVGAKSRSFVAARQLSAALDDAFAGSSGIALFALGSYAVEEARMMSDVDLLVVTDGADVAEVTTGVQQINRWFTDGGILKLDFRLRGEGASAPLVQDLSFYDGYFEQRMSLWERVAFAKCRPWWGERGLQKRFLDGLRRTVGRPFSPTEVAELARTRQRVEMLAPKKYRVWDTKRAGGGRYDIEYLTAIALAATAADDPDFFGMSTPERLHRIAQNGVITRDELTACVGALDLFSLVEYLMELQAFSHPTSIDRHEHLSRYLDNAFEFLEIDAPGGVEKRIEQSKKNVRRVYQRVVEGAQA